MNLILLITILTGTLTWFLTKFISKRKQFNKISEIIGSPPRHPIFGCLPLILGKDPVEAFNVLMGFCHKYGKNGNCVNWGPGNYIVVHLTNPKDVESLLNNKTVVKKSIYKFLTPWMGLGLLTSSGQKYFNHRKLITPAFHFKILEEFADIFIEKDKKLIEKLKSKVDDNDEFEIYELISAVTLDNICETSMGVKLNTIDGENQEYQQAVKDMAEIVFHRLFNPLHRNEFTFRLTPTYQRQKKIVNTLHTFGKNVIMQRRQELKRNVTSITQDEDDIGLKQKQSLLDLLLHSTLNGEPLSDDEIREEIDTFMFAGHDTTTSSVAFTLYSLAIYPEIQENVFHSINSLVGSDLSMDPTYSQLQEMKYLDMVIKETMRLHPSVPLIGRTLTAPTKLAGVELPSGTEMAIPIYAMHRSPLIWKDPEVFDPNRFSEEESSKRGPYDYIAFSAGYRNCIGQKFGVLEVKSIVVAILRNFKIVATEKTKNLKCRSDMTLRPVDGLFIKLERRVY